MSIAVLWEIDISCSIVRNQPTKLTKRKYSIASQIVAVLRFITPLYSLALLDYSPGEATFAFLHSPSTSWMYEPTLMKDNEPRESTNTWRNMWIKRQSMPCNKCSESPVPTTSRFCSVPICRRMEHYAITNMKTKVWWPFLLSDFSSNISNSATAASQHHTFNRDSNLETVSFESRKKAESFSVSRVISKTFNTRLFRSLIRSRDADLLKDAALREFIYYK